MDIPSITTPAARSAGPVIPLAATPTEAIEQAQSLPLQPVAPTTVDLSTLGRFLSLASLLQKKTLDLQTSVAANADTSKPLADVAVSAAAVASVFNELQTNAVDNTGLPTGTLGEQSLASQFFQQLGGTQEDAEASLAAIGLSFTPATTTTPSNLTVDDSALQDAFRQDPAATSAVLERSADAFFGVVSTQVQAQAGNLPLFADDSGTDAALPLPAALPPNLPATPSQADAQVASNANDLFMQNLVTESLRSDDEPPNDSPTGLARPVAQTDLDNGSDLPVQADVLASPAPAAPAQGARVAPLPGEPDAQAIAANAAPAEPRQPEAIATPTATVVPTATTAPTAAAAQAATTPTVATAQAATTPTVATAPTATTAPIATTPPATATPPAATAPIPTSAPPAAAAPSTEDQIQPAPTATTQAATTASETDTTASNAGAVVQEARVLAQQLQAEREAARQLDEKIASASDAVRAALAEDIAKRDAARVDKLNLERTVEQRRADQLEQLEQAQADAIAPDQFVRQASTVRTVPTAESAIAVQNADQEVPVQQPVPPAPNQAQQAARDPAIAAAIAAYNVNTGAFAAQNGRPDIQPPKAKPIAPVAGVTKVAAAEAIGTPRDGPSQSR